MKSPRVAGLRRLLLVFTTISEESFKEMVLPSLAEERDDPLASLRPLPPCEATPGASGAAASVRGELLLLLLLLLLFRLARFFLRAEREGDAAIRCHRVVTKKTRSMFTLACPRRTTFAEMRRARQRCAISYSGRLAAQESDRTSGQK